MKNEKYIVKKHRNVNILIHKTLGLTIYYGLVSEDTDSFFKENPDLVY